MHNHERLVPVGGSISRPPTQEQCALISGLAKVPKLSCLQVISIVEGKPEFSKPLEPHQVSNVMAKARSDARNEIAAVGGDFNAILGFLEEKARNEGWKCEVLTDGTNTVTALWWQSDLQNQLSQCYCNILLNDNTYNRNNCGYILNVGIIIDSFGKSRNAFYVLHA